MAQSGTVVRYFPDRGFGFIRPDASTDGQNVFFHVSACREMKQVDAGVKVEFLVGRDNRGRAKATAVAQPGTSSLAKPKKPRRGAKKKKKSRRGENETKKPRRAEDVAKEAPASAKRAFLRDVPYQLHVLYPAVAEYMKVRADHPPLSLSLSLSLSLTHTHTHTNITHIHTHTHTHTRHNCRNRLRALFMPQ